MPALRPSAQSYGGDVRTQTCQIEAGASESWCVYGWGSKNPGGWDPGDYKVELFIGTTKIAEKPFVVTGHLASVGDVHSLFPGGFTQEVNLFESGWDIPRTDRHYTSVFDGSLTRYVNWELHLKFARSEQARTFGVKAVYTKLPNLRIAVQNQTCQIEAGASESWCMYGWGSKNPGGWDPGDYKVELFIGTTKIAEKLFVVT